MDLLVELIGSTIKYILFICVAIGGVFLGKNLRAKKEAKQAKSE